MKERKEFKIEELYNLLDILTKAYQKDKEKSYDYFGFDKYGIHKDSKNKYNLEGYDMKGIHKDTKNKYNPNGFDINGLI